MTDKQELFCREYLVDCNATQAAMRAGYSEKNADKIGPELLGKTRVRERVAELQEERAIRVQVSADWVLRRLAKNVDRSMQAEPVFDHEGNLTGEYRYAGNVANKALELIGRHLGMFTDKLEAKLEVDTMTDEQRQERINELIARRGTGTPPSS